MSGFVTFSRRLCNSPLQHHSVSHCPICASVLPLAFIIPLMGLGGCKWLTQCPLGHFCPRLLLPHYASPFVLQMHGCECVCVSLCIGLSCLLYILHTIWVEVILFLFLNLHTDFPVYYVHQGTSSAIQYSSPAIKPSFMKVRYWLNSVVILMAVIQLLCI